MNNRRSILEPQDEETTTTTAGGTNDKYWSYRSHERQIPETRTTGDILLLKP